jgi:peptidoglycan/LPS O-acetylase OafA/YrhL
VTVVLGHSLSVFPNYDRPTRGISHLAGLNLVKYTPLALVHARGDTAVILFFVLSGLVLTLPYLGSRAPSYPAFVAKRVFRLYPAYLVAVALAVAAAALVGGGHLSGLSAWANAPWHEGFGAGVLANHAAMLGSFDNGRYDPVLWSMVHELRISFVFPLLVVALLAIGPARAVAAAVAVLIAGVALDDRVGSSPDYFATLMYAFAFVAGILLARHRAAVLERFAALSRAGRALLLVGGIALYTYPNWVDGRWVRGATSNITQTAAITVGGCAFVVFALGSPRAGALLRRRVPQFLGRISYSLYLLHAVVLLALLHVAHDQIPTAGIIALMWALSIPLAALCYRWVELPGIAAGKRIAARLDARRPAAGRSPAAVAAGRRGPVR